MTVSDTAAPTRHPEPQLESGYEALAARVDEAVKGLAQLDAPARAVAEELKAAIEEIHRAALVTIVRRLRADEATRAALYELVDDPVVHLLLSLHHIVRPDPMTQAAKALQEVRPQLQGHGGDVTLVRIDDGTAYVRLSGACNGCSMSSVTLRNLVEKALLEGTTSITAVEVLPNEPQTTVIAAEALFDSPRLREDGWARAGSAAAITADGLTTMRLTAPDSGREIPVLIVSHDGRLSGYVNECAHEALPLDNAVLDSENGTLMCPWHGFCYDALSGECLTAPEAQLEQLPLRVSNGTVWIRVGT